MKKLELKEMEVVEGGRKNCQGDALGFLAGAAIGGTLSGGPLGFMIGSTVGLIGSTFIAIAKFC